MEVAKFTREAPCTKVHIWRAFRRAGKYPAVSVVEARSIIGLPASKYLVKQGYVSTSSLKGVDYYRMSPEGIQWLEKGLRRHLELHPEDVEDLHEPLPTPRAAFRKKTVAQAIALAPVVAAVRRRRVA
jgi:DNA-binding PadR family transcriptional regulator